MNETNVLLSITLPIEPEALIQDLENEQETLENIFSNINLDNLISSTESEKEPISLSQEEIRSYDKETTEESSSQKESDLKKDQSISNSILIKLIDNLMIEQEEVFTRINPLIGITYKEKLKEIISRLKIESQGKQRDQPIKTLKAYYYLGQLRENAKENRQRLKYTRHTLKKSLSPRRADRI